MEQNLLVKSLRVEKTLTYNDRDDDYEDNQIYILNCKDGCNKKYEIILWTEYGDCYSGWCAASWGHGSIKEVECFCGMTHKANKELKISVKSSNGELLDQDNDVFGLCENNDAYYPDGYAQVEMSLFEEVNRNKEKRPVWIFKGNSCLGKSYLAAIIANSGYMKEVYETDAHEKLDKIHEDIIVLGNKYPYSVEEVEKYIMGEHETIIVDFKSE